MATTKFTKKVPKKTRPKDLEDPKAEPSRGKRSPSRVKRGQLADTHDEDIHHKTRGSGAKVAKKTGPRRRRPAPGVAAAEVEAALPETRGGPTAKRNAKKKAPKATSALEGSLEERPSRKSTRKSANRAKSATELTRREQRKTRAPEKRAERAAAKGRSGGKAAAGGKAKISKTRKK